MLTAEVSKMCAADSAKAGCHAWLAHPTIADDLATTVRQVLDYDTDAPASMDDALLGFTTCPACESDSVRSTARRCRPVLLLQGVRVLLARRTADAQGPDVPSLSYYGRRARRRTIIR
jgi:hypothetical protein